MNAKRNRLMLLFLSLSVPFLISVSLLSVDFKSFTWVWLYLRALIFAA